MTKVLGWTIPQGNSKETAPFGPNHNTALQLTHVRTPTWKCLVRGIPLELNKPLEIPTIR